MLETLTKNWTKFTKGTIHGAVLPALCVFCLEALGVRPEISLLGAICYLVFAGMVYELMSNDPDKETAAFTFYSWGLFVIMLIVSFWMVIPKYGQFLMN